jgi:hypothetical protein
MPMVRVAHWANIRRANLVGAALIAGLLALLSACGGPEAQPLRFGAAAWQPGETSVYRVTDVNNEPAGTVRYEMQAPGPGTWRMERVTQTQGDEERLSVEMDEAGFRTRASDLERISPDGSERVTASYDGGEVQLELTTKSDVRTSETVNVPSDSRDERALFMLLRTLPLEIGYSTKVNTFQPVTSRMARATVTVIGDEPVETPVGTFDAWLVVLDEGDRQSRAWIGKEAPFPLVKYIDASNGGLFELADYSQGE